ncbi:hypothetical protein [Bacillus solitudinis]|uniref:hypothetical protein n=1 Tax=Bacillus solitudinis TaxID=2014074 RepID=UPI000C234647|nr:hypothetical protein [Bacillus solitudinis]
MQINISQNEFQRLATFKQYDSIEEMNKTVNSHLPNISAGERRFLTLISQYSCFKTHIGCCWRKRREISNELEVSSRTITNYISSLVKKNVIKVIETYCNGKKGANIFIILPVKVEDETKNASPNVPSPSRLIKTQTKSNKEIRKEEPTIDQLNHEFVPSNVPKDFISVCKPYFNAKTIYSLWGKCLLAASKVGTHDIISLLPSIIRQLKGTVFFIKKNRVRDLMSYWYSGVYQVLIQDKRKQADNIPSWLTGGLAQ